VTGYRKFMPAWRERAGFSRISNFSGREGAERDGQGGEKCDTTTTTTDCSLVERGPIGPFSPFPAAKVANPAKAAAPVVPFRPAAAAKVANPAKAPPAELVAILSAFPGATTMLRPPTPIPPPLVMGEWEVWSAPLPARRGSGKRRVPTPTPLPCVHCGEACDLRDMEVCRLSEGRLEHLGCWLKRSKLRDRDDG
jgi:hypothetical protein